MKRTLILGASVKPERYAHIATLRLTSYGHQVFPVGLREGKIGEHDILTNRPQLESIDTVTLYVGPQHQPEYYDYIVNQINPCRIIFNPGTENEELVSLAHEHGIKTEIACTLVLLSIGSY